MAEFEAESQDYHRTARWNCILYYSVVLLEPNVAKKCGLPGDTETEEDLTSLRKRVSFFFDKFFLTLKLYKVAGIVAMIGAAQQHQHLETIK